MKEKKVGVRIVTKCLHRPAQEAPLSNLFFKPEIYPVEYSGRLVNCYLLFDRFSELDLTPPMDQEDFSSWPGEQNRRREGSTVRIRGRWTQSWREEAEILQCGSVFPRRDQGEELTVDPVWLHNGGIISLETRDRTFTAAPQVTWTLAFWLSPQLAGLTSGGV